MNFTTFEEKIIEAINDCTGGVKHCGSHSITHLTKAWRLRSEDIEMAMFRGITAEEEAASCLFFSLKNNGYKNANRLLFKEHTYKLGVVPFLNSISNFLSTTFGNEASPFENYNLEHVKQSGRKALALGIKLRGRELQAWPQPPLHFFVGDQGTGETYDFKQDFTESTQGQNYRDALEHIKAIASQRSSILYASPEGPPSVEGNIDNYLLNQKRKVLVLLSVVLLSDPWVKEYGLSGFVQQALDAYLLLLKRIEKESVSAMPA